MSPTRAFFNSIEGLSAVEVLAQSRAKGNEQRSSDAAPWDTALGTTQGSGDRDVAWGGGILPQSPDELERARGIVRATLQDGPLTAFERALAELVLDLSEKKGTNGHVD